MTDSNSSSGLGLGGLGSLIIIAFLGYFFFGRTFDGAVGLVLFVYISALICIVPLVGFPIWLFWIHPEFITVFGLHTNVITALFTGLFFVEWLIITIVLLGIIFAAASD